jgi:hypothetical protein
LLCRFWLLLRFLIFAATDSAATDSREEIGFHVLDFGQGGRRVAPPVSRLLAATTSLRV